VKIPQIVAKTIKLSQGELVAKTSLFWIDFENVLREFFTNKK
jgi:hypothetical protein